MIRALRIMGRTVWFLWELCVAILNYLFTAAFAPKDTKRLARAAWLHRSSKRHLQIVNYTAAVEGPVPKSGIFVSNHLSYLDILAIASVTPAVFVSKSEVRRWPVFGWCAMLAGTIFIDRKQRTQVGEVNRQIQSAIDSGLLVVIFPEGTTSNGDDVLPFRSSLLEPAVQAEKNITLGWLHYEVPDGDARDDVCYWGDHMFVPHLIKLLGKQSIHASVRFGRFSDVVTDRKVLAQRLRSEILRLKEESAKPQMTGAGSS